MSKASHKLFRTDAVQFILKCSAKWETSEAQKFKKKFIPNSKNLSGPERVAVNASILAT